MQKVLTNAQMRRADFYTINTLGVPSAELMRRAGLAIAEEVAQTADKLGTTDILVVCGVGNNGGDGYVCANELLKRGYAVKVYAFEDNTTEECKSVKNAYIGGYTKDINGSIIVDCIFGTGLSRNIEGEYAEVISKINLSGVYVISADIPSGINGDNGNIFGCAVNANVTVAIAEYKAGHFLSDGLDYCGKIIKKDIGITCPDDNYINIYDNKDLQPFYPKRKRNSHKGTYGSANVIAGSDRYIGAAALCLSAALKSGCGFVKLTTAEQVKLSLAPVYPQAIYIDEPDLSSEAIAIGSGCGVSSELYEHINYLLTNYKGKLIIDADGLNSLAKYGVEILKKKTCKVILTPHIKEFSRLSGLTVEEIISNSVTSAVQFAERFGVTLVLKSASTIITDGKQNAINVRGNTALAKGGSGDILTGYMCGCAARGLNEFDSAVCAVSTLGISAEISAEDKTEYCANAKDIVNNLHFSIKRLTE